jgi:2-polyprenyl-3-methyl-5-hydroxy-6-metoxy-1,4-benzoquinol methylase
MRRLTLCLAHLLILTAGLTTQAQQPSPGQKALAEFMTWKDLPANAQLPWDQALQRYQAKLTQSGLTAEAATKQIRLITAYDEATLYNRVYSEPANFNTQPNQFLQSALDELTPGEALDVGMGQGRNTILLARNGWKVTGFDVAEVGLQKARDLATSLGLTIRAVHASDAEFDFGRQRWDLIVIIHAIEKHSVYRVRQALRPGGAVVIEAAHKQPGGYPFGFESNELLKIFDGFQILRYEERLGLHDFGDRTRPERLVRILARKPL